VESKMVLEDKAIEDVLESIMHLDEDIDESVYSKKNRAKLVEDGEMSYEEEGFMEGYNFGEDANAEQ
jgi:hypothetical protein